MKRKRKREKVQGRCAEAPARPANVSRDQIQENLLRSGENRKSYFVIALDKANLARISPTLARFSPIRRRETFAVHVALKIWRLYYRGERQALWQETNERWILQRGDS